MAWNKPLPNYDIEHKPFWDALRRHEFVLFRCKKCGTYYWPVSFCRKCENEPLFGNMEWAPASGRGKVFAHNIHYWSFEPAFDEDIPYVYAIVELEEGPLMPSNVIGCDPSEVTPGMPVQLVFKDITEEHTIPVFRPA
jgi:uncharacterized OB-fold protein